VEEPRALARGAPLESYKPPFEKPLLQSIIPFSHIEPRTYKMVTYYHPLSLPLTHPIELYAHYIPFVKNLRMQNRLQHIPFFHIFNRLVDFFEWIEGYQSVKREMSFFALYSCWFLFRAYERESSPLTHRHVMYILISFLVIAVAQTKIAVLLGLDNGYLMLLACCSQTSQSLQKMKDIDEVTILKDYKPK
jgi:hypothetical protein